jgi:hypothetical protein
MWKSTKQPKQHRNLASKAGRADNQVSKREEAVETQKPNQKQRQTSNTINTDTLERTSEPYHGLVSTIVNATNRGILHLQQL